MPIDRIIGLLQIHKRRKYIFPVREILFAHLPYSKHLFHAPSTLSKPTMLLPIMHSVKHLFHAPSTLSKPTMLLPIMHSVPALHDPNRKYCSKYTGKYCAQYTRNYSRKCCTNAPSLRMHPPICTLIIIIKMDCRQFISTRATPGANAVSINIFPIYVSMILYQQICKF